MLNQGKIKDFLSSFWHSGEKYVVVEILNHYIQATVLKADLKDKKIRIIKNWQQPIANINNTPEVLRITGQLLKKIRKLSRHNIILNLDSKLATTIYSSVPVVRQRPSEVIDEADIDNLISQAIWRFFDRQRDSVAKKMGIDDVDVLLSDVRVRGVKLDGHKVMNPIGFKAKSAEFYFSQTFAPRDFIRGLKDILPLEKMVFMSEVGTILAHAVLNVLKPEHLFLANLFPDKTVIYTASPGKLRYLDRYDWGQENLLSHLKNHLWIEPETAKTVIDLYNQNKASPMFLRRLENILIKELQIFFNGLESTVDKEETRVYLNPYFDLPTITFSQRCQARLGKSLKISPLPADLFVRNFGFEVKFNKSVQVKNPLTILAAFSEIVSLPQDDKLSYLAKRRVRWLVT